MLQRFQSRRQVSRKLNRQILRGSLYACEALEKRVLLSLVVPVLHSLPGAAKTLYLDFTGNPAFEWNGQKAHGPGSVNAPIPAFSMDADVNNFSALELTTIQNIWAIAAEKFSPFNLDVTTEDPGNRTQGTTLLDIIGGSNSDWSGTGSGVSVLGSFNNPNLSGSLAVFAWSGDLPWSTNIPFATSFLGGYVIPHEAGHSFSLAHQRSGTNPITEYYGGDSTRSPIMGGSGNVTGNNPAIRGIWWRTNMDGLQNSPDPVQDDLSILTSPGNGFGYRPFDHYYSNPFSITTLTPDSNGQLSTGTGVIARTTDVAPFQFQAIGPTGSFTINASVNGGMLKPFLNLVDASTMSNVSSTTVESATSANLTTNSLSPGHYYYIEARSAGNYGDIGQYTITGVLQNFAYLSGSTIHIIGFGDNANNITISRNSSTYTVTDSIFGGTATQTFAASLVGDINVALGGGDDTLNFGAGAFTSMVTATIAMGGGNNALIVDDSANTAVTSYELFSNQIDRQGFSFLGLAQFDSSVKSVKLYTGGQLGDVVSVYSTTVPTTIQNQNDTTINIGNFSRTVGIQGALTIINPIGGTSVNINDSADPTGKNVIFSDHGIFGLCANINWTTADVNGVTVSGGQGGNSFTVTGTDPVVGGAQNILYAGTSSDYVDIEQTTRPLTVNTQTGADTVYVGAAGNLDSIQGALLTVNGNSSSTLTLQDYLNPYYIVPTVDTFTNTTFTRDGVSLVVVNLVGVQFVQHIATIVNSGFGNVVLNTGALINTVNVESDASPITVNTQSGGNIYVALSQNAENLDNVPALVTVHGNGTDAVLVEDQNNASLVVTQNFLTATSLTRIGATYIFPQGIPIFVVHPASVSYSGVGSVTFDAGTLTNTYYVHGTTPTTAYVINGGAGSDLLDLGQGNLTNVVSATIFNGGGITFNPGGGADELLLDDSNSSAPLSYLINPGTLDIVNHLHVAFGNGLALVLNAGTGADTETISGTGFGVPLTINESSGNATGLITGSNVNSPIAIHAGGGTDNFTVGATGGTLILFSALVTVTGQTGNASLTVNDRADKNFSVSSTKVVEKFGNFDGYAVDYAHLANLTVNVGAGGSGNTMTVSSTAPGTALFVNEAAGNNSVIIGNAANTQAILGDVTIGNVLGQTALLVDDSADTNGRTVTLTKSAITGLAPAIIHYIENGSTTTGIRPLTLKTGVAVFFGKPRYDGFGGTFFRRLIWTRKSSSGS